MAVLLRATKGSNLTPTEADANLTDLENNANSRALQTDFEDLETEVGTKQNSDADLTAIAGLSPSNDDLLQRKAGAWTNRTPAQVKTDLALVKGDVGLGNVDNTADSAKPVSTAQATAIGLKKTDSMSTNKLLGRGTAGTGAIEEITLGTNLSFTGTTLNAAGGSASPVAFVVQTASQASYALDVNSLPEGNFGITSTLAATSFTFPNLLNGAVANIEYFKTVSAGGSCTLTFPATSTIVNEGVEESGLTAVLVGSISSVFYIYVKKTTSNYRVFIKRSVV